MKAFQSDRGGVTNTKLHSNHTRNIAAWFLLLLLFLHSVPSVLANPWDGAFDWLSVPEIYPGIRHAQLTFATPRPLKVNALLIDTRNPDIRFATTDRHPNWGQLMTPPPFVTFTQNYYIRTGRQRTLDFLNEKRNQGLNMVAAVNASPWQPWAELSFWQTTYGFADRLGLLVSNGVLVDDGNGRPSLIVGKDGLLRMQSSVAGTDITNILQAVSGFAFALVNGAAQGDVTTLAPRTGYGLTVDRRYLILMTIDGRQTGFSEGASIAEVGYFLRHFGAWTGLNMDGGGSTTMALRSPQSGSTSVVNSPSESPRINGSNFGIYYIDPQNPEPIAFEDWLQYRGVPLAERLPLVDSSGDGLPNILAYLFNIHPMLGLKSGDPNPLPTTEIIENPPGQSLLTLRFRVNRHAVNASLTPEASTTLRANSWTNSPNIVVTPLGTDPLTNDTIYRASIPITTPALFLRLRGAATP